MEGINAYRQHINNRLSTKLKPFALVLWLAITTPNFLYSQENNWTNTELINESNERNIEKFKSEIEQRNINISASSYKTQDVYVENMKQQLEYYVLNDAKVKEELNKIVNILNSKYSQNVSMDNYLVVLQSAFKILASNPKYNWLNEYTDKFSSKFDINFENALQFVQYMNNLSHNWSLKLQKKAGKSVLACIIADLNYKATNQQHNEQWRVNNQQNNGQSRVNNQQHNGQSRENNLAIGDNTYENVELPPVQPNTGTNNWNLNNNSTPRVETNYETSNINLLSKNLSFDKLNWVNYEDVLHMVNAIKHDWLRNAVMGCLVNNDVIWAQRLLWMDINCDPNKYPNFVASRKLWRRELRLMEEHWEYMTLKDSQEVLNYFKSLAEFYELNEYEPYKIYKKFLSWEWKFNNHWLPYCIISKYDYKLYLFSADHKLIFETPVLTWATAWNKPNDHKNGVSTTPWWMYSFWWFFDRDYKWNNLYSFYGSEFWMCDPRDWQYPLKLSKNKEYYEAVLGIHGEGNLQGIKYILNDKWEVIWQKKVKRTELFGDPYAPNNTPTAWCICMPKEKYWILKNNFKNWSLIWICFDDEIIDAKYLWYKFDDGIETIEHFGKKPGNVIQLETAELINNNSNRNHYNTNQSNWLFAHKDWFNNSEQNNMRSMLDTKRANLAYALLNNKCKSYNQHW